MDLYKFESQPKQCLLRIMCDEFDCALLSFYNSMNINYRVGFAVHAPLDRICISGFMVTALIKCNRRKPPVFF